MTSWAATGVTAANRAPAMSGKARRSGEKLGMGDPPCGNGSVFVFPSATASAVRWSDQYSDQTFRPSSRCVGQEAAARPGPH